MQPLPYSWCVPFRPSMPLLTLRVGSAPPKGVPILPRGGMGLGLVSAEGWPYLPCCGAIASKLTQGRMVIGQAVFLRYEHGSSDRRYCDKHCMTLSAALVGVHAHLNLGTATTGVTLV